MAEEGHDTGLERGQVLAFRQGRGSPPEDAVESDIPISAIDLEDVTYRFRVEMKIADLVRSIATDGQQVPIILRRSADREKLQLVCGFRRVAALRQLGRATVRALVRVGMTDEEAFRLSILENQHRASLNDIDRAHALLRYREQFGKRLEELTPIFGLRKSQLIRIMRLTKFPQILQDAIAEGVVKTTHAVRLMEHLGEHPEDATVQRWIERIAKGISVEDLQKQIGKAERAAERKAKNDTGTILFRPAKDDAPDARSVRLLPMKVTPKKMSQKERSDLRSALTELLQLVGPE